MTLTHPRLRTIAAVAAAAITTLAPAAAQAAEPTAAVCENTFTATISPGFSLIPTSGTETTDGETGTILCAGMIRGHRVTGLGAIGFDTTYTASTCTSESSTGTVQFTVPTTGGTQRVEGALAVWRTALAVRVEVRAPDMSFTGIGVVVPTEGTCLLSPIRQALISITGSLSAT
jgi:hypothetical protein